MSHKDNWYDHTIRTISAVLDEGGNVQEFAASFYELDSSIVDFDDNCDISSLLQRAASIYGIKNILEIVGCAGLIAEEDSSLHTILKDWFLSNKPPSSSRQPRQEPSLSP